MDPNKTPEKRYKRTSRLRSALYALRGEPVVPESIRAEWVAWQFEFEAVLDKLSAAAARLYTRDKAALKAALQKLAEMDEQKAADPIAEITAHYGGGWNPAKRALNRQVLAMKGIRIPDTITGGKPDEHGDQSIDGTGP